MVWTPSAAIAVTAQVATLLTTATDPHPEIDASPSRKLMVPVAPAVTVAVKVMLAPGAVEKAVVLDVESVVVVGVEAPV